jgi:hypothetical protein
MGTTSDATWSPTGSVGGKATASPDRLPGEKDFLALALPEPRARTVPGTNVCAQTCTNTHPHCGYG